MLNVNIVTDYGAGTGVGDNTPLFNQAENDVSIAGGGSIYVPPIGTYQLGSAIFQRNNVTLYSTGAGAILQNSVSSVNGIDMFCILCGNFKPTDFAKTQHFNIQNVVKGATSVTLTTAAERSNFTVGGTVFVDSVDGWTNIDGDFKPWVATINRVKTIFSSGAIQLEDPILADITGAKLAPTNLFIGGSGLNPTTTYILQNSNIHDIKFVSLHGAWCQRFGAYKSYWRNLFLQTTDILPANGLSHCFFNNLQGQFSQKIIEPAIYSHDFVIDGVTATLWGGATDPGKPLIKLGENVRNGVIRNVTANTGSGVVTFNNIIRLDEGAFGNTVDTCGFTAVNVPGAGVTFEGSATARIQKNTVKNCTMTLGNTRSYIEFNALGGVTGNIVKKNTFSGATNNDVIGTVGNNVVAPNNYLH